MRPITVYSITKFHLRRAPAARVPRGPVEAPARVGVEPHERVLPVARALERRALARAEDQVQAFGELPLEAVLLAALCVLQRGGHEDHAVHVRLGAGIVL